MSIELIAGPSWAGWYFHQGQFFAPGWRGGLDPGHILALPYLEQLQAEYRRRDRELADLRRQVTATARLAGFYRRQLVLESKFGLMLTVP